MTSSSTNMKNPFTEITQREHAIALADTRMHGWQQALAASQKRQDDISRLIVSTASSGLACQAGCWYCCYFKVDAHAEEVFRIVDYVKAKFNPSRAARLQEDVAANAKTLRSLSPEQQLSANLKCPFLDDGKCSIYDVRPARCKTFHATDVDGCKQAYENPTNLNIPGSLVPELFYAGEAHLKGFRQALDDSGYDVSVYELNSALEMALADATPKRRFEKRKRAFVGLGR
ncbi:MAG: YkgJ family cysteine cluster protein [Pseudohongiella sp.]|nr:YkgJ family cysteine cluster protein [Pseudohongiella sp.]MDO9520810.1 YkgJ family cysteine cluster protein [Pseudohongiella sp.]MDP2128127.1 YkgJ family cysteine cluster protein [Pseudohongiella sp.]